MLVGSNLSDIALNLIVKKTYVFVLIPFFGHQFAQSVFLQNIRGRLGGDRDDKQKGLCQCVRECGRAEYGVWWQGTTRAEWKWRGGDLTLPSLDLEPQMLSSSSSSVWIVHQLHLTIAGIGAVWQAATFELRMTDGRMTDWAYTHTHTHTHSHTT